MKNNRRRLSVLPLILVPALLLGLPPAIAPLSPAAGAPPGIAAAWAQAEAVDPESGKRADETGSESDEPARPGLSGQSNLPVPRFASLRASEVNLRTGPGVRYPVDWVFRRRGLPIEIVGEFGTWRKIRDEQGTEGWVHRQMLSGKRSLVITGKEQVLRRAAEAGAPAVARVEPGVVAQIMECTGEWCRVEAQGFRGWLARAGTWGTKPDERIR